MANVNVHDAPKSSLKIIEHLNLLASIILFLIKNNSLTRKLRLFYLENYSKPIYCSRAYSYSCYTTLYNIENESCINRY